MARAAGDSLLSTPRGQLVVMCGCDASGAGARKAGPPCHVSTGVGLQDCPPLHRVLSAAIRCSANAWNPPGPFTEEPFMIPLRRRSSKTCRCDSLSSSTQSRTSRMSARTSPNRALLEHVPTPTVAAIAPVLTRTVMRSPQDICEPFYVPSPDSWGAGGLRERRVSQVFGMREGAGPAGQRVLGRAAVQW